MCVTENGNLTVPHAGFPFDGFCRKIYLIKMTVSYKGPLFTNRHQKRARGKRGMIVVAGNV